MQIAIVCRDDLLLNRGGDTTQILLLRDALLEKNISVFINPNQNQIKNCDIVHFFNIQRTGDLVQFKKLSENLDAKTVKVFTPIIWDLTNAHWELCKLGPPENRLSNLIKYYARRIRFNFRTWREWRSFINSCDYLFVNSIAETEYLVYELNMPSLRAKSKIMANVIDHRKFKYQNKSKKDIDLLIAARVEPLKGHHLLLNAIDYGVQHEELKIVFVGKKPEKNYLKQLMKYRSFGSVYFAGEKNSDDLRLLYMQSKVHVLPSLRESPGLATLEASACGTKCIASCYAPVQEYFDHPNIIVCDPFDTKLFASVITDTLDLFADTASDTRYVSSQHVGKFIRLYDSILNDKL